MKAARLGGILWKSIGSIKSRSRRARRRRRQRSTSFEIGSGRTPRGRPRGRRWADNMSPIGIVIFDFDALVVRAPSARTLILDDLVRFGDYYANLLLLGSLRHVKLPTNDTINSQHDGLDATIEQWYYRCRYYREGWVKREERLLDETNKAVKTTYVVM